MTSIPTFGPGTVLIFGIVLAPVYLMLLSWYFGEPSGKIPFRLGVTYLVGFTVSLWGGMYLFTVLLGVIYF